MKKTILLLVVTLITSLSFSQESLKNHKKIYFEYKIRSTIEYRDNGFYIDSLILKWDYPDLVYEKVQINNKAFGFVKIENISDENKKKLLSEIGHTNHNEKYKFNIKKQKYTKDNHFYCDGNLKKTYEALNSHCSETRGVTSYSFDVYFNKKEVDYYGLEKFKSIEWVNSNFGFFTQGGTDIVFKNLVEFDNSLPKYITPTVFFENNEFGIKKIYSTYYTTELISYRFD